VIRGGSRERSHIIKKLMLLVAMLAVVVTMASVAALIMSQEMKMEEKKGKGKEKEKRNKMKEMPKTGGIPVNTAVLGLGAGALLVGGGQLVRKVTR
jgi:uncharacterized membrane protein YbjE (DUF340 family)